MGVLELIGKFIKNFKFTNTQLIWIASLAILSSFLLIRQSYRLGEKNSIESRRFEVLESNYQNISNNMYNINNKIDSLSFSIDNKFKEGYEEGVKILDQHQQSLQDQLQFIIDYREKDKELLKKAIEIKQNQTTDAISRSVYEAIKKIEDEKRLNKGGYSDKELSIGVRPKNNYIKELDNIDINVLDSISNTNKIIQFSKNKNGTYHIIYE